MVITSTEHNLDGDYYASDGWIQLRWDSQVNSDLIDKYSIIRDNVVIIENAPNNPQSAQIGFDEWNNNQYIRDYSNLENCRTYKYKVRTHLCNNLSIDSEEIPVTVQRV